MKFINIISDIYEFSFDHIFDSNFLRIFNEAFWVFNALPLLPDGSLRHWNFDSRFQHIFGFWIFLYVYFEHLFGLYCFSIFVFLGFVFCEDIELLGSWLKLLTLLAMGGERLRKRISKINLILFISLASRRCWIYFWDFIWQGLT